VFTVERHTPRERDICDDASAEPEVHCEHVLSLELAAAGLVARTLAVYEPRVGRVRAPE